jgi:phasin family protein
MIKSFEDIQSFGKDTFEAYVSSANAMTKGFQAIAAEQAEFARKSLEKGTEAFEKATQVKSIDKAFEVQQGYAKDAYEAFTSQMNKVGELYAAVAKDAFKPFESKMAAFGVKAPK